MNDAAIKTFCAEAREALTSGVELRMRRYGILPEGSPDAAAIEVGGVPLSPDECKQRAELLRMQESLGQGDAERGWHRLRDRAAYTWFNRIVAIRFMEVRDYLPSRVRMFTDERCEFGSQAVACALDVEIQGMDPQRVLQLKQQGDDEELFRYLLLSQCRELAECLPDVFEPVGGAMELLLPGKLMAKDGVVARMVALIPESDWNKHVEILGWMYQYYNAQAKDDFFKSKAKATAETLPAATQLFTPEWIVRYMVQNSLGRLWMLNNPQSTLRERMEYYIEPDAEHEDFIAIAGPEDITLCDPACGSGHILVYAFDLLFAMYEERGYREREIPSLILQKNLRGLEIDPRAAQLASLALAMCAREHDRRFFGRGVRASVRVVAPVVIGEDELPEGAQLRKHPQLLEALAHLDEVGSLLNPTPEELAALATDAEALSRAAAGGDMFADNVAERVAQAKEMCDALAERYDCVVANPPYMGSSSFSPFMSKWVKKNYPDVKSDLFSSFIVRIANFAKAGGEIGMMTPFVWMFIGSYEKLRAKMIDEKSITSLIQLEYSGFAGATVPICTFTFHNAHVDGYRGGYVRLSDFTGASVQAPKALEAIQNPDCGWFYRRNADTFKQIPGSPIAYWASDGLMDSFVHAKALATAGRASKGIITGDNDYSLRLWWECADSKIDFKSSSLSEAMAGGKVWFPCNKGGVFRKWYGNHDYVINWINNGLNVFQHAKDTGHHSQDYDDALKFKPNITWSIIGSGAPSFRYREKELSEQSGTSFYPRSASSSFILACLNSSSALGFLKLLCPTLNMTIGDVLKVPIAYSDYNDIQATESVSDACVKCSKSDWDSFETSWDFKRHPLL